MPTNVYGNMKGQDVSGTTEGTGGSSGNNSSYSNVEGDFVAAVKTADSNIVTITGFRHTLTALQVLAGKEAEIISTETGDVTKIPLTNISVTGNDITFGDVSPTASGWTTDDQVHIVLKAFPKFSDTHQNTIMTFLTNPDSEKRTGVITLATEQDVTAVEANVGPPIPNPNMDRIILFVAWDANDGEDVVLSIHGKKSFSDTFEGVIKQPDDCAITLWSGTGSDDEETYIRTIGATPVIQIKVKADTAGATPADVTVAYMLYKD